MTDDPHETNTVEHPDREFLTPEEMAALVARDIPTGSYVNLGIGQPTTVADYLDADAGVTLHTENGMLSMGPQAHGAGIDPDLTNAGKIPVTELPGASYFHHADSFAMMRGGHLDVCVLGAFQVSEHGDLANWHTGAPDAIPAVGGAMDLAIGAKQVFVMMSLFAKDGTPKLVPACTYPLTGLACVSRVYTEYAIFDVGPDGATVLETFGTSVGRPTPGQPAVTPRTVGSTHGGWKHASRVRRARERMMTDRRDDVVKVDVLAIRQVIDNWAVWRDAGDWERFATVWHRDGYMTATWFQGSATDFIAMSRAGFESGVRILHFLGGAAVDVVGDRAIAQTKMAINQRGSVHDVDCDVVCTGRFYDFFSKDAGEWQIVRRQPIYEKDRLDPVSPDAELHLDATRLEAYPEGYRHLAYLQLEAGVDVKPGLPGLTGDVVQNLYREGAAWLQGSPTPGTPA